MHAREDGPPPSDPTPTLPAEGTPPTAPAEGGMRRVGLPGRRIGRYEVLHELGRGGMGVVYEARHLDLGRNVALKVMVAGEHAGEETLERFLREARAAARLSHPGIVQVHDVGREGALHFFTMELIRGRTLAQLLKDGEVPPRRAAEIVRKVAQALAHAHAQGVLHRDVKPGNVLVDDSGEARLADFGLAKDLSAPGLTATGAAIGTPTYASPEQIGGGAVGPLSDVYSLGATLYEALAGRPPFTGETPFAILQQVIQEDPSPPRRWNERIHRDVEAICLKAMEKDPARRYASAAELADDLGRYLDGEPIRVRPMGLAGRTWRRVARNPLPWSLAAALLAATAVVLGLAWRAADRERAARDAEDRRIQTSLAELARSGEALVEAALARRALGDLAGCARFTERLVEPIETLKRLDPTRPEPWYHEGRMLRAQGREEAAERAQDRAVALSEASGPRDVGLLARYERGVLKAGRYQRAREARRTEMLRAQGGPGLPTTDEVEAAFPELASLRGSAAQDLKMSRGAVDSARRDVAEGILALLEGDHGDDARAKLEHAVAADAFLVEAHAALAALAEAAGDWQEAARRYEAGHAADRGYLPHVLGLSSALGMAAVQEEGKGSDAGALVERAVRVVEEAIAQDRSRFAAWEHLAEHREWQATALAAKGKDPTAAFQAAMEAARAATPPSAPSLRHEAGAHLGLGDWKRRHGVDPLAEYALAREALEKALALDPKDASAANDLGIAFKSMGDWKAGHGGDPTADFEAAREAYGRALAAWPLHAQAAGNLGGLHNAIARRAARHGGDPRPSWEAARAAYDRSLSIRPASARMLNNRANVHASTAEWLRHRGEDPVAEYGKALEGYAAALRIHAGFVDAWYDQGNVRMGLGDWRRGKGQDPTGDYASAAEAYGHVVALVPNDAGAARSLADVHSAIAEWRADTGGDPFPEIDAAREGYERAIDLNPGDPNSHGNLGNLLKRRGELRAARGEDPLADYEASIAAHKRALAIDPGDAAGHYNLGIAHRAVGDWRRSRGADGSADHGRSMEAYARALAIDPKLWQANVNRGVLLEEAGRIEEAVASYEAAFAIVRDGHQGLRGWLTEARVALARKHAKAASANGAEAARLLDLAFGQLRKAVELGLEASTLANDTDLAPLRSDPRWEELRGQR